MLEHLEGDACAPHEDALLHQERAQRRTAARRAATRDGASRTRTPRAPVCSPRHVRGAEHQARVLGMAAAIRVIEGREERRQAPGASRAPRSRGTAAQTGESAPDTRPRHCRCAVEATR